MKEVRKGRKMRKTKIKTIDATAYEWLDKINGNSYFAGVITVNYGMKSERRYTMPYQYGYGDAYIQAARNKLVEVGEKLPTSSKNESLRMICADGNIILRCVKHENCRKAGLKKI